MCRLEGGGVCEVCARAYEDYGRREVIEELTAGITRDV